MGRPLCLCSVEYARYRLPSSSAVKLRRSLLHSRAKMTHSTTKVSVQETG